MKHLILFSTLIILWGCNRWRCHPEAEYGQVVQQKEIISQYDTVEQKMIYDITDGNMLLFAYNHVGAQCDDVYDDEWGEKLFFVMDPNIEEFELLDSAILTSHCYYQEYGAWVTSDMYPISQGSIRGKKISGTQWELSVMVWTTPIYPGQLVRRISFVRKFVL